MGVYVKGMEMPTRCSCCRMEIDETDYCLGYNCAITRNRTDSARKTRVRNDCPLVPVPPHGDLIDRKTAYDSLLDGMVMTGYQSRALDCISDFFVPTILMAEEGET